MKKVFTSVLAAALLLMGTQAYAQLSVGAGYLNSQETTKITNNNDPSKADLNGFYAGINYNIPIVAGLGIAPGFYVDMLVGKGNGSIGNQTLGASVTEKYTEVALNVPLNLNYNFNLGRDVSLFVYAGPVFQYGVHSESKFEGTISANIFGVNLNRTENYKYNHYQGNDDLKADRKPFNIYMGGGVGLQVADAFQVIVGYDHSLMNFSAVDDTKTSRSQIKVGVGFSF